MPYDFPTAPTEGQVYVPPVGGQTYIFKSPRWLVEGIPPAAGGGGGGGGIGEAPEDGKQYARQSAAWAENDWDDVKDKPATFPPTLPIPSSGITGLDAKQASQDAAILAAVPVGACISFPATVAPAGFVKRNGSLLSRAAYAALWAFAQASGNLVASDAAWTGSEGAFSPGDGSTTFRIPDGRGEFDRNWDDGRGIDIGRAIGARQAANLESHTHPFTGSALPTHNHTASSGINSADHTHSFSDSSSASGTGSANHQHSPAGLGGSGSAAYYNIASSYNPSNVTNSTGAAHTHTVAVSGTTGANSVDHTHVITNVAISAGTPAGTVDPAGSGTDTRPRNVALLACIKY